MKKLALFLDGTWNTVSDNTNVWRLKALCAERDGDGLEQRAYYSAGLGTERGERLRGGMSGSGIDTAITKAYEWLVDNYDKGDQIFIFGFSRGAYTARSLSGMIAICGLLHKGAPIGVNQIYKRYRRRGEQKRFWQTEEPNRPRTIRELRDPNNYPGPLDLEDQWVSDFSRSVDIDFIGVFDTVGALGVPFQLWRKLRGEAYPFLNTGLRVSNNFAFHALAIDEHRKAFRPTLWTNIRSTAAVRPIEKTEQRWFVGAHANVGGGCFTDSLAQIPFDWLIAKAEKCGLTFSARHVRPVNAHLGRISDSYAEMAYGLYRILTFFRRFYRPLDTPPIDEPNAANINETIDATVFQRWQTDHTYRPPALKAWANKKQVNLGTLKFNVSAATAEPIDPINQSQ